MTSPAVTFLDARAVASGAGSAVDAIVLEQFVEELRIALTLSIEPAESLRRLGATRANAIREFETVLLRHEKPESWKRYLDNLSSRTDNEVIKGILKKLVHWIAPLCEGNGLNEDHPLQIAVNVAVARAIGTDDEQFVRDFEAAGEAIRAAMPDLLVPAAREWICVAIRRIRFEPAARPHGGNAVTSPALEGQQTMDGGRFTRDIPGPSGQSGNRQVATRTGDKRRTGSERGRTT